MSEADRQNVFASQAAQRAAQIVVVTNVSQAYFNQRRLAAQLAIAKETLQLSAVLRLRRATAGDRQHQRAGSGAGARRDWKHPRRYR